MNSFYLENLTGNQFIELGISESHHCINVFRNKIGDLIKVLDGNGKELKCKITKFHKGIITAEITEQITHKKNKFNPHIAISPTKSNDRINWFIEKSIEIGVSKITFIQAQRTERNKINLERIKKIGISTIKQSGQFYLPQFSELIKFNDFIKSINEEKSYIACLSGNIKSSHLLSNYVKGESSCILIGPEGDFTQDEINLAISEGCIPVSLGNNILRTETAGIFSVNTINLVNATR